MWVKLSVKINFQNTLRLRTTIHFSSLLPDAILIRQNCSCSFNKWTSACGPYAGSPTAAGTNWNQLQIQQKTEFMKNMRRVHLMVLKCNLLRWRLDFSRRFVVQSILFLIYPFWIKFMRWIWRFIFFRQSNMLVLIDIEISALTVVPSASIELTSRLRLELHGAGVEPEPAVNPLLRMKC